MPTGDWHLLPFGVDPGEMTKGLAGLQVTVEGSAGLLKRRAGLGVPDA